MPFKNDPLVAIVRQTMENTMLQRQAEQLLNEELGIESRNSLPHEHKPSYDSLLQEISDTIRNGSGTGVYLSEDTGGKIDESLKLIKTHTNGNKTAKVYRDAQWEEFRVKHYTDGKHHIEADYHTNDKEDAHSTAQYWLKKSNINEIFDKGKKGASKLSRYLMAVADDSAGRYEKDGYNGSDDLSPARVRKDNNRAHGVLRALKHHSRDDRDEHEWLKGEYEGSALALGGAKKFEPDEVDTYKINKKDMRDQLKDNIGKIRRKHSRLHPINEISNNLRKRYIKKASADRVGLVDKENRAYDKAGTSKKYDEYKHHMDMTRKYIRKRLNRMQGIERAVDKLKEDYQLDEISGKTLGNYIQKAHTDSEEKKFKVSSYNADPLVKSLKKHISYNQQMSATKPWSSSLFRSIIDSDKADLAKRMEKYNTSEKDVRDIRKRAKGMNIAVHKLMRGDFTTNEETEQLDELSKDTLKAYIRKALPSFSVHGERIAKIEGPRDRHGDQKYQKDPDLISIHANLSRKWLNREKGIHQAVDKLEEAKTPKHIHIQQAKGLGFSGKVHKFKINYSLD